MDRQLAIRAILTAFMITGSAMDCIAVAAGSARECLTELGVTDEEIVEALLFVVADTA